MRTLEAWARRLKPRPGRGGRGVPRLWLVSDPVRLPDPRAAAARLPAGSGVLARGAAEEVLRDLSRGPSRLVVGGDGRAALRHRTGLHLPEREVPGLLPFLAARRGGAPWAWLTVAVHGRRALARARRLRPDAGCVSPAFPTTSHPGAPALGPLRWVALARCLPCPAVALGGVAPGSAGRLPQCRATGLAAIGALRSRT